MFILCIFGVAIIAGVVWFFYRNIVQLIVGVTILVFGILAYYLIEKADAPWFLTILVCGVLAGVFCIPGFLVTTVDNLKKELGKSDDDSKNLIKNFINKLR